MENLKETASYKVEAAWTGHSGLPAIVLVDKGTGTRSGFVGVPESHATYGHHHKDLQFPPETGNIHRGLDFSSGCVDGNALQAQDILDASYHWFGFYTCHPGDGVLQGYPGHDAAHPAETLAYCIIECERLAASLKGYYRRKFGAKKVYNINNHTPHPIHIYNNDGVQLLEIPPIGQMTRLTAEERRNGWIWVVSANNEPLPKPRRIPISRLDFGEPIDLPSADSATLVVTSSLVRESLLNERPDVVSPGPLLRTEDGTIYGCRGLTISASAFESEYDEGEYDEIDD